MGTYVGLFISIIFQVIGYQVRAPNSVTAEFFSLFLGDIEFYEKKKNMKAVPQTIQLALTAASSRSHSLPFKKKKWKFSRYFYNQLLHSDFKTLTEEDD